MDERIFDVIDRYRNSNNVKNDNSNYGCYQNWALDEILMYILDRPNDSISDSLFDFNMLMSMYKSEEKRNFNFYLACEVACNISEEIATLYSKEASV